MTPRTAADRARDELVALERYLRKRGMLDEFSLTNLWLVVGPWHGANASCPHKVDCATSRKCNGDCASDCGCLEGTCESKPDGCRMAAEVARRDPKAM